MDDRRQVDRILMAAGHMQEEFDVFILVGLPADRNKPPMSMHQGPTHVCRALLKTTLDRVGMTDELNEEDDSLN